MSSLDFEVHEWQIETMWICLDQIRPDEDAPPIIDIDEMCYMGAFSPPPPGMEWLDSSAFSQEPECYFFALKDGRPVFGSEWLQKVGPVLGTIDSGLKNQLNKLRNIYASHNQKCPDVIKTAVVFGTGEALTIQEYDELKPYAGTDMTSADIAFDRWISQIALYGSAFKELND